MKEQKATAIVDLKGRLFFIPVDYRKAPFELHLCPFGATLWKMREGNNKVATIPLWSWLFTGKILQLRRKSFISWS